MKITFQVPAGHTKYHEFDKTLVIKADKADVKLKGWWSIIQDVQNSPRDLACRRAGASRGEEAEQGRAGVG